MLVLFLTSDYHVLYYPLSLLVLLCLLSCAMAITLPTPFVARHHCIYSYYFVSLKLICPESPAYHLHIAKRNLFMLLDSNAEIYSLPNVFPSPMCFYVFRLCALCFLFLLRVESSPTLLRNPCNLYVSHTIALWCVFLNFASVRLSRHMVVFMIHFSPFYILPTPMTCCLLMVPCIYC